MGIIKKLRLLNRQGMEVGDIYPISSTLAIYSDDTLQDSSLRKKDLNSIIDILVTRIENAGGGAISGIIVDDASMYPENYINLGTSLNPWKDFYINGEIYSKDENQTTIHTTLQELIEGAAGGSDFEQSPFANLTQQDWDAKITRPTGGTQGQVLTIGNDNTLIWADTASPITTIAFADITGQPSDNTNLATALNAKEDLLTIVSSSGTTLTAEVGKYYYYASTINSLDITLPAITSNTVLRSLAFRMYIGGSPAITFNPGSGVNIKIQDGLELVPGRTYEVLATWNNNEWVLTSVDIV